MDSVRVFGEATALTLTDSEAEQLIQQISAQLASQTEAIGG